MAEEGSIIETQGLIVSIEDIENVNIVLNLTEEQKRNFSSVNSKPISYSVLDVSTISEGEIVDGIAYRARVRNIDVDLSNEKLKKIAIAQLRSYSMKTNGLFMCKVLSVNKDHNLEIELYDPLSNKSLACYILKKKRYEKEV